VNVSLAVSHFVAVRSGGFPPNPGKLKKFIRRIN
jgi:hypothetical protein